MLTFELKNEKKSELFNLHLEISERKSKLPLFHLKSILTFVMYDIYSLSIAL